VKVFHCDRCGQLVFFENTHCLRCGSALGYVPSRAALVALSPAGNGQWGTGASGDLVRLCHNYTVHDVCNWTVAAEDPSPLCISCRLTRVIPDLSRAGAREAWYRLEVAKRRLVYSLLALRLPLVAKDADPEAGLAFAFLADPDGAGEPVLTGHRQGAITINSAEADDAERERRRVALREPYRTLLGHVRHESGHYYWDRLIRDTEHLPEFRARFGDERQDYGEALARHHASGPPPDWSHQYISGYATMHPWEDWAETWAHYLHVIDMLETAAVCGLSLDPRRPDEPTLQARPSGSFDAMMADWFSLTYVLNNLNRALGLPDGYPFVLSEATIEKLRFVHALTSSPPILPATTTPS
jgi:hypothetical protein